MSLNYYENFQQVGIDRAFRDDLRKVIRVIEESKSQNEFQISVGKLVGMVHFIANLKFQDELAPSYVGEVAAPSYPTANVEARHADVPVSIRR